MSTQILYLSQIRTELRGVTFQNVETTSGQYNDVVIINREWVFRFPRLREDVARGQAEARVLTLLRGRLPLPIPDPVVQRFDPPVPGLAFSGYRSLSGQPLALGALDGAAEGAREAVSTQLARFLRALHGIPLAELEGPLPGSGTLLLSGTLPGGSQVQDGRLTWEKMFADVKARLFPAMRPDARRAVTGHFEAYLDDGSLHVFDPCLRHGDFGGANILWNPQTAAVTGVLDFSFCALGDPAMDLASASTLGADVLERMLPVYTPIPGSRAALDARARFYRGLFALEEALEGLRLNDERAYAAGMEHYR